MTRHILRCTLIFAFFALIACLALYPLLLHATTHVGGEWTTDYYHFHWGYWWIRHALATPGLNVYETNFVLFPYTTNFALETLTPFWYPLWALLEPLVGTLVAMDVIMVTAMALAGTCFYALLRHERVAVGLALAFGVLLEVSAGMMLAAMLETINYLSLFWLPLNLLIWSYVAHSRGRAALIWTVVLGLAFYGMMMTDLQHILFLAFLIVPYGVLTLIEQANWSGRIRLIGRGVAALAIMTALLWIAGPLPYLLSYDYSSLAPMSIESAGGIPFPLGYVWRFDTYNRTVTLGSLVLPLIVLALIVGRRVRDRRRWFWLALAILPLLIALGPYIHLDGLQISTPYVLLHRVFGGLFRSPARFDAVIMIAALLFASKTLTPLIRRWQNRHWNVRYGVAAAALLLVVLDARLFTPMPIQPVTPPYAYYETIGKEQGDPYDSEVILEVPIAGGSGEAWVGDFRPMETEFYGMTHGKRMLNGAVARAPLSYFWYWLYDDPMLAWLGQRRYLEPDTVEAQLRERIFDWHIGYIIVHQDLIGRQTSTDNEVIGYLNGLGNLLCPVAVEGDAVFYRTAWHPDGCPPRMPPETSPGVYTIDVGSPGDEGYLGWGWHYQEDISGVMMRWAGILPRETPQTTIYVDLPPNSYTLTLTAQAFWKTRHLNVMINDTILAESATIPVDSLHDFTFSIPASAVGNGKHIKLTLDYDTAVAPADVEDSADTRQLALAIDTIRFARSDSTDPATE